MKEREVKCFIVNKDISIFQYELLEGYMTNQVEIIGESGKKYILGNFKTLKEAKDFVNRINK